jgi:Na+-translocating ferredoxin:NAD+ oxidoreductase RnfD subunit
VFANLPGEAQSAHTYMKTHLDNGRRYSSAHNWRHYARVVCVASVFVIVDRALCHIVSVGMLRGVHTCVLAHGDLIIIHDSCAAYVPDAAVLFKSPLTSCAPPTLCQLSTY